MSEQNFLQSLQLQTDGKDRKSIPAQFRRSLDKETYEDIYKIGQQQLAELASLPFWIDNVTLEEHEEIRHQVNKATGKDICCYCHAIGLPKKNIGGQIKELPIFDYEIEMMQYYRAYNKVFMRKPRGFGATTFNNYYLSNIAIKQGHKYNSYRIMYVSGIGYAAAVDMIFRLRELFMRNYPELIMSYYSTNEIQVINGMMFQAFAGENINALRHYHNVYCIVVDEGDLFIPSVVKQILGVISTYEEKSGSKIILLSTAYLPDGLFYNIEFETGEDYLGWHKILKDYTHGMNKIYDPVFIEREKGRTYFRREYMGKYEGDVGNMYPVSWVQAANEIATMFPNWKTQPVLPQLVHFIGIDPAWGASDQAGRFSITVTRYNPYARYPAIKAPDDYYKRIMVDENSDYNLRFNSDAAEIIHFEQHLRPNLRDALKTCENLYKKYGRKNVYFVVDGSSIPFIEALKVQMNENIDYQLLDPDLWVPSQGFKVVPLLPTEENNSAMRRNLYSLLAGRIVSLPQEFRPIAVGIGSATGRGFKLDKPKSPENHALDSTSLSMKFIKVLNQDRKIFYSE